MVQAKNLKWRERENAGDSFVKVYLWQNGMKISKKNTVVKQRDICPIFKEAMISSVPLQVLPSVQIRVTIDEQLPENKDTSIGHVII